MFLEGMHRVFDLAGYPDILKAGYRVSGRSDILPDTDISVNTKITVLTGKYYRYLCGGVGTITKENQTCERL
jgi:hypothetical protein